MKKNAIRPTERKEHTAMKNNFVEGKTIHTIATATELQFFSIYFSIFLIWIFVFVLVFSQIAQLTSFWGEGVLRAK
jgi:hypothetical protein